MSEVDFTMLGMTGSGKTCFLIGMYYEMSSGIQSYTLSSDDDTDIKLRQSWEKLCDEENNVNRFPVGTDQTESYKFTLEYAYEPIKAFNWLDYPGGDLEKKNTGNLDSYKVIKEAILKSTCLFICVDGELLCEKDKGKMINNVRNKCSSKINSFLSDYQKNNSFLPPVSIVITKYDKCRDIKCEVMEDVIKKAFSSLFPENQDRNKIVTIIPVSIGKNISDDNYSGRLEPINIHVPLFFGIWFALNKDMNLYNKAEEEKKTEVISIENEIKRKTGKFFCFKKKKKIESLNIRLQKSKKELRILQNKIKRQKEYIAKIHTQLEDMDVYMGGVKSKIDCIDFSKRGDENETIYFDSL